MKKLLSKIESLKINALEYRGKGRGYPTWGINNLVDELERIEKKLARRVNKEKKAKADTKALNDKFDDIFGPAYPNEPAILLVSPNKAGKALKKSIKKSKKKVAV